MCIEEKVQLEGDDLLLLTFFVSVALVLVVKSSLMFAGKSETSMEVSKIRNTSEDVLSCENKECEREEGYETARI